MRGLGEDASEWYTGQRHKLDMLCMQEGGGQSLLLLRGEHFIWWCLSQLKGQGCSLSLKQVLSGSHYLSS